jgi:hypothetical protein
MDRNLMEIQKSEIQILIIPPRPPLVKSARLETEGGGGDLIVLNLGNLGLFGIWRLGFGILPPLN